MLPAAARAMGILILAPGDLDRHSGFASGTKGLTTEGIFPANYGPGGSLRFEIICHMLLYLLKNGPIHDSRDCIFHVDQP